MDALVKPQMRYSYQEGGRDGTCTGNAAAEETQVSEPQIRTDEPSPVLLFVFYGQGVARALSDTIEEQLHRGNVYAVDIPYEQKDEQTYELLRQKLLAIDRGAGVLAVYDQKVLQQMLYTISCETGTQLRAVALPVTRFGMEWSKGGGNRRWGGPGLPDGGRVARGAVAFSQKSNRYIMYHKRGRCAADEAVSHPA